MTIREKASLNKAARAMGYANVLVLRTVEGGEQITFVPHRSSNPGSLQRVTFFSMEEAEVFSGIRRTPAPAPAVAPEPVSRTTAPKRRRARVLGFRGI